MDTNINIKDIYYKKYIKYKTKYLELKEQSGGVWKNCNDEHKINNIGSIINIQKNLFFAYNKTSQLNREHYIIIETTYNELINILKPLIKPLITSYSSLLTGNSSKHKIYTEIKEKLVESYKLYRSFETSYEYNKEELDTDIKLNNIFLIFKNKSYDLKKEILIIDENIKTFKIDNNKNKDLINKINLYFEHIYTSLLCLKPSIKVKNSVTSAKQQNNIEMRQNRQNMITYINNYTPTTITQQTVLRHSQTVPVTPSPHTGSAPYSNNTKTDSVRDDSRKKMITSLYTVPHPRSSITQQLVHQTVPATAHQTAPIPTINHSQVRISRPLNNIVLLPLNPEPPFRKTQTPQEPPPRTAPQPPPRTAPKPPRTAPKPPPRTAPT